jgi:hypothetical protein
MKIRGSRDTQPFCSAPGGSHFHRVRRLSRVTVIRFRLSQLFGLFLFPGSEYEGEITCVAMVAYGFVDLNTVENQGGPYLFDLYEVTLVF